MARRPPLPRAEPGAGAAAGDARLHRRPRALPRQPGQGALSRRRLRGLAAAASGCSARSQRARRRETLRGAAGRLSTTARRRCSTGPARTCCRRATSRPGTSARFGSQLFVFDWGEARADASPLDDVLHYLMIQRALRSRPIACASCARRCGARTTSRAQAYPEWSWRPQRDRRADAGLPARRDPAPRARAAADPVVGAYWRFSKNARPGCRTDMKERIEHEQQQPPPPAISTLRAACAAAAPASRSTTTTSTTATTSRTRREQPRAQAKRPR